MRGKEIEVAQATKTPATVAEVMAELAALEDPKIRAVNEKHGDDHGVNLTKLRALAKQLKTEHELAGELWHTGNGAARLLALLICRPKAFEAAEPDPLVARAGWALTTHRVTKKSEGLDLPGLLDTIEAEMKTAPDRLQWAMNHCLAQIGIDHAEYRARAIDIGERLEVLKDYPTPPNCTSPFAPIWIAEIVRRQEGR
ncbi:DNA alkylation repair protein [Nocardia flavorosea]|nr:DNA alkylation repair protein [Nocardia flavorosea]MBF6352171.1 DNA alkylation repair protein [Nocardia flavorosea]